MPSSLSYTGNPHKRRAQRGASSVRSHCCTPPSANTSQPMRGRKLAKFASDAGNPGCRESLAPLGAYVVELSFGINDLQV